MSILTAILMFVASVIAAGVAVALFFACLSAFYEWRDNRQADTGADGMTEEDMRRIKEMDLR